MKMTITFATRPSALARWQTGYVINLIREQFPEIVCRELVITTRGDKTLDRPLPEIGGKGLFTEELERALLQKKADVAVHSLKDLPVEQPDGLTLGLIPRRASVQDAWICPQDKRMDTLPAGSVVGTSSLRRAAQLRNLRPDLNIKPLRGNVDTRLRKVRERQYDAIILAAAGVQRLGLDEHITHLIPVTDMLPAPGQGALAVQCRADDHAILALLSALDDRETRLATTAERAFLTALGGGCSLPIAAYAQVTQGEIHLRGVVVSLDGRRKVSVHGSGSNPDVLGASLAAQAMAGGAQEILSQIEAAQ